MGTYAAPQAPHTELKRGSVGLLGAIVMSCAFVAPAAVMLFGNLFIAIFAGPDIALVYLVSMFIVLTIGYSVGKLTQKFPSAGAFYTFSARAFGAKTGFMTGWLIFVGYAVLVPAQSAIFGSWVHEVLFRSGIDIPWWIFSLFLTTLVVVLAVLGIRPSLRWGLVGLGFEVAVITILAIIILAKGGAGGLSAQPFEPMAHFSSWNGVALGLVFGIWGFLGFESAATLGEEVRNPRRTIPVAVLVAVVVLGVYYIVVSYAEAVGFGTQSAGIHRLTTNTAAFDTLALTYSGTLLRILVDIAAMTSLFALQMATVNATARVLFAMGREGVLPRSIGTTSRRYQTPHVAIIAIGVFAVVVVIPAGIAWGPANAFGYLAFLATIAFIPVYGLINASVIRTYIRDFRNEFRIIPHAVVPAIGICGLIWVLKGNVWPIPAAPYNIFIYLIIGYVILGVFVAWWLGRNRPEAMSKVGMILASAEEVEEEPDGSRV